MAFNRWLVDFCSEAPGRLLGPGARVLRRRRPGGGRRPLGQGARARRDPDAAALPRREVLLRPGARPGLGRVREVGLPISQHGGTGAPDYPPAVFAALMALATEHSFFSGRSLWQMILGGVFDRFPDLKLAFVETEVCWIAPMIELLDEREQMGDDWMEFARVAAPAQRISSSRASTGRRTATPASPRSTPSRSRGRPRAATTAPTAGSASTATTPCSASTTRTSSRSSRTHGPRASPRRPTPQVTEADARKILYGNAAEVYGFDLDALQPDIDRVGFELDDLVAAGA